MLDLQAIEPPDSTWVERLRPDNWIYLVKENCFARVAHSLEIEPGHVCGQIFIHKFPNNTFTGTEQWYVRSDGRGLDNNPLIAPVFGNVPAEPLPVVGSEVQKLSRQLHELDKRVKKIESGLSQLLENFHCTF